MSTKKAKIALWLSLILLALVGHALGDVVHLKDGSKLEGKILSEGTKGIKIRTRFGTVDIPRSRIDKIEKGKSAREEYQDRKAALSSRDVNGRFELALFCKQKKLSKEYKALLQEILKIAPGHDGANRELGRIQYQGRWFTKKELEEFKRLEQQEMESKGMVFYDGHWMTKDEAMQAQGYVNVDGEWLARSDADRLRAQRDFEKIFGVPLSITDSAHFSMRSTRTEEENEYLLDIFEQGYEYFVELCEPTPKEREFLDYYKLTIYLLNESSQLNTFIESDYIGRYKPPKNTRERYLGTTNFAYYFPIPLIVLTEGRHLKAGGDRETALIGMVTVHLGQTFLRRIKRGGALPGWAEAGIGHHFEGRLNEHATISVVEFPWFEPYVEKWIDEWETFARWNSKLLDPNIRNGLPSLRELMEMDIEILRVDSLAKSWSLVTFLLEHRRKQFFNFAREAKIKFRGERVSSSTAFEAAFAPENIEDVEAAWVQWLTTDAPRILGPAGGGPLR
jgi:hypothetical protein